MLSTPLLSRDITTIAYENPYLVGVEDQEEY